MPTRNRKVQRIATPIQGEDAYVMVKSPTWGQLIALDEASRSADYNTTGRLLTELVEGWNWVDDDGKPLPLPSTPGVLSMLSMEEVAALSAAIGEATKPPLASGPSSSAT